MQTAGLSAQSDTANMPDGASGRAQAPLPLPGVPANAAMDAAFIARNQIVERYLAGKLPLKGAQDFERYCRQHPELLEEIALNERIHAALRLLEVGGQPPPWEVAPKRWWEKLSTLIIVSVLAVAMGVGLLIVSGHLASLERTVAGLQHRAAERPLDPAVSTRSIAIVPNRLSAPASSQVVIGGSAAEMAELKIDMAWTQYAVYRVVIDRVDQARVGTLYNVIRDSSGALHIGLNSSAFGPGDYLLSIEGLTWRGEPVPVAWVRLSVTH